MRTFGFGAFLWISAGWVWASPPFWALRDTQQMNGAIFRVVCSGSGPSIGFARQDALDSCKLSAVQQLSSEVTVRSMSITSERDAAFQQEVSALTRVTGLTCSPLREEIQESDANVRLWLLCEFDLSRAKVLDGGVPKRVPPDAPSSALVAAYLQDNRKALRVAVIPACEDMIVRGGGPARVVPCAHNPVTLLLGVSDREITFRARGFFPKSISVSALQEFRDADPIILQPAT